MVASRWANAVAGAGIGEVVGGHVDGLHAGDRALVRRGDALLEGAHLGRERGLVTDGARDAAEERRHFRARLREAEDVVDEEQHVLPFLVAEVLGDGERRERDAGAGARRLVHLAEDERRLARARLRRSRASTRSSRGRGRCLRGCARRRRRSTDTPPCALATLLMSSWMSTVLPTPAPPKRPILPPLR